MRSKGIWPSNKASSLSFGSVFTGMRGGIKALLRVARGVATLADGARPAGDATVQLEVEAVKEPRIANIHSRCKR